MKTSSLLAIVLFTIALLTPSFSNASIVIVDSFAEAGSTGFGLSHPFFGSNIWAQKFNTNGTDYTLDKISVRIQSTNSPGFNAKVWTSSGLVPQTEIATLSLINTPSPGPYDTYEFGTTAPLLLDGSTDYFFSVESQGGAAILQSTVFGSNNYLGSGTLFSQLAASFDGGTTWSGSSTNHAVIRIEGTPQSFATPEPSTFVYGLVLLGGVAFRRRR